MEERVFETQLGGRSLRIVLGRYARQANGSVMIYSGDTAVLVAATMTKAPREGMDFFPLLVDFEEKLYSVGRIPGAWGRREGRPPDSAILSARMVDRTLRPLFPKGMRNDVQVVCTALSVDKDAPPDVIGMVGASIALSISDIPFGGPIAGVRVGRVNGEYIVNPTVAQSEASDLDLIVAGTREAVTMVEAGAKEIPEDALLGAIEFGHEAIKALVAWQDQIVAEVGVEKREVPLYVPDEALVAEVKTRATERIAQAVLSADKQTREEQMSAAKEAIVAEFTELYPDDPGIIKHVKEILGSVEKEQVRALVTQKGLRVDGRALEEIRPISVDVGFLPRVHGSAMFRRGQTQVVNVCTLGCTRDAQLLDGIGDEDSKRYMHHYNFPSYSVGEVRPSRGPGRREIGHGLLAERALIPVLPSEEEFPYTLRLVSEVFESNGSSSMASVCGSTLSMMDAGVPIKKPVAGIAMGLVKHGDKFAVLTDIQGVEDALGDMDFKVAGTPDGITAVQMDIKITGVSREILKQALEQARQARAVILGKMAEVIAQPRAELSPFAPRMLTMQIDVDKIRTIIGPGGKMIRKIIEESGAQIDVEDDGRIFILSVDENAARKAKTMIEDLIRDVEVGATYTGKVTRLMNFGAFVEILPGKEGLVHISQMAHERVGQVEDVCQVGDEMTVKVLEIDRQGRINLSRKALMEPPAKPEGKPEGEPRPERPDRRPPRN